MNKIRNLIVGLTIVSLLAVGVVAVAGNGFGASANWEPQQAATGDCDLHERDADGDGILNSEDPDWTRPMDGSGYGERKGNAGNGPLDGSGFGARQGGGFGQGRDGGNCDGDCL
ncbi:hypothetical protein KAT84_03065 [Candidatus Bipolaricaulota bacterium]|nr:hypothetical protein [Candidatus Bipolaricaulota bacterium]